MFQDFATLSLDTRSTHLPTWCCCHLVYFVFGVREHGNEMVHSCKKLGFNDDNFTAKGLLKNNNKLTDTHKKTTSTELFSCIRYQHVKRCMECHVCSIVIRISNFIARF